MKELIPYIDANYRTIGTSAGRAVSGFSMGGDGSMRLAMKYPEPFCAAASMGGAFGWNVDGARAEKDTAFRWSGEPAEQLKDKVALKFVAEVRIPDGRRLQAIRARRFRVRFFVSIGDKQATVLRTPISWT